MRTATDACLFYLVVDVQDGNPIYVFLERDPAENGGSPAEPVQLELLPPMARFGRPGRPSFGRPVLGKARSANCFREFPSSEDLWEAGFLPVTSYRVCDDWNDYHMPWTPAAEEQTAAVSFDDSM
jgi:hypothetical protein